MSWFAPRRPHLAGWWAENFTPEEQATIIEQFEKYPPLGTTYDVARLPHDARFLNNASTWFTRKDMSRVRIRMLDVARTEFEKSGNVADLHYTYMGLENAWYKLRDEDPSAIATSIEYAESMVAIAPKVSEALRAEGVWPVTNPGYCRLVVAYDKQGRWQEAIDLCEQAQKQGWAGDWHARVERYRKKLDKARRS